MIKVDNKKALSNLTRNYLKANKRRNLIIILGIVLTSLLITSVFTVASILKESTEAHNFRQVGAKFHGSFQYITEEEVDNLKSDPLIKSYGIRKLFGIGVNKEFSKSQVEVSYMDENSAKNLFLSPEVGRLPKEGTKEIACDDEVLKLLGVEKKLGEKVYLEVILGNKEVIEDTFTLVGWWKYDIAMFSNQAIISKSYIDEKLTGYINEKHDNTGTYSLNVFFDSSRNIADKMAEVASKYGYQVSDESQENYIDTGVNWGYLNSQFKEKATIEVIISILFFTIIIGVSGYLIIYNIFQISVLQDIQFYGLLKTIGTTKKQIKKIIYSQGLILSALGIPIGISLGLIIGNLLSERIIGTLNNIEIVHGISPLAILFSIIFSLIIVLLSARKPGIMAGKVAPVEAVKYVENVDKFSKKSKSTKNKNEFTMAMANLTRNKKKTIISAVSIALALVLFQGSINMTNGFSEEKYLEKSLVTDFILGNANYFNTAIMPIDKERTISEEEITALTDNINVKESGKLYKDHKGRIALSEEEFFMWNGMDVSLEELPYDNNEKGEILDFAMLMGFNEFLLDKLGVFEGSIEDVKNYEEGIIAIYTSDDYGNPVLSSNLKKIGDVVEITDSSQETREYKVLATATIKYPMSVRYSGPLAFALPEERLNLGSEDVGIMAYLFDVEKEDLEETEELIGDYTTKINPNLDYESKKMILENFSSLKNTVSIVGISFSAVLGIIGILNFFNSIITSIISRGREFAILKAIGMTDKQIKKMLNLESVFYIALSSAISFSITFILNKFIWPNLEEVLWFYQGESSYLALILLIGIFTTMGISISNLGNKMINRKTVVERLK